MKTEVQYKPFYDSSLEINRKPFVNSGGLSCFLPCPAFSVEAAVLDGFGEVLHAGFLEKRRF
jgi:hypothetical protein